MIDPRALETGELIRYVMGRFRAERRERFIAPLNGGRAMRIHGPGEKVLWLPNGDHVKVAVDDSGVATQIEQPDNLHAIVRPHPIRARLQLTAVTGSASTRAQPRPIKTSVVPRRNT